MAPWHADYFVLKEFREQQTLEEALLYLLVCLKLGLPRKKIITYIFFPEFSLNSSHIVGQKTEVCQHTWMDFYHTPKPSILFFKKYLKFPDLSYN
jgi:hypothetical protein